MECNKDEAIRAKEIDRADVKQQGHWWSSKIRYEDSKPFPRRWWPFSLHIYVASEKKINGEVDLYGILSVDPSADVETIRKHYRRLALALHPDKNKSVGGGWGI